MLECNNESKTLRWNCSGTYGRGTPVDALDTIVPSNDGKGIALSLSESGVACN